MSNHLDRVISTDRDRIAAIGAAENAISDAYAAGRTVSEIATALGVKNRSRVYAIIGKPGWQAPEEQPQIPVVVCLRTRKRDHVYEPLRQAMAARGWFVEPDYLRAWHLARAGVRVMAVDASAHLAETIDSYGYHQQISVAHVRARYSAQGDHELVEVTQSIEPEPRTTGENGVEGIDAAQVARWVAEHIPTVIR